MIYDCFQFFNEIDILKMRLNILNNTVDKFVICESTITFSGEKKPLYFEQNKDEFTEFTNKIIHIIVEDTPSKINPFQRDSFQKCAVKRGLTDCSETDIIIFSDVDEIPNPLALTGILAKFDPTKVYHLAQRNFYCYLNMEEVSGSLLSFTGEFDGIKNKKWLGTKVCSYKLLKPITMESLRFPDKKEIGIRVDNGGWHFSYMGGDGERESVKERVAYKIKSAAHQEFNTLKVMLQLNKRIKSNKDIFGRNAKFEIVNIDETYPRYLLEHIEEYRYLIK